MWVKEFTGHIKNTLLSNFMTLNYGK